MFPSAQASFLYAQLYVLPWDSTFRNWRALFCPWEFLPTGSWCCFFWKCLWPSCNRAPLITSLCASSFQPHRGALAGRRVTAGSWQFAPVRLQGATVAKSVSQPHTYRLHRSSPSPCVRTQSSVLLSPQQRCSLCSCRPGTGAGRPPASTSHVLCTQWPLLLPCAAACSGRR